jgi:chromosome partitioning protein
MKIISIINYKGGVGKTTLTANLAAALAMRGEKILVIDLDPQASLTFSFIKPDYWKDNVADNKTIRQLFHTKRNTALNIQDIIIEPSEINNIVRPQGGALSLISSHLELINVDLDLATRLAGANLQQAKENFITTHRILLEGLLQLDEKQYDMILIDCPPNFNIVTKNAIVASSKILIPAKPDYLSTLGIDYLKRSLANLINDYNEYCDVIDSDFNAEKIHPQIMGVVFTMVQYYRGRPISSLRQFINQTTLLGVPVFENKMRENKTVFADAGQYSVPVVADKPGERPQIVEELESLTTEFINKL